MFQELVPLVKASDKVVITLSMQGDEMTVVVAPTVTTACVDQPKEPNTYVPRAKEGSVDSSTIPTARDWIGCRGSGSGCSSAY